MIRLGFSSLFLGIVLGLSLLLPGQAAGLSTDSKAEYAISLLLSAEYALSQGYWAESGAEGVPAALEYYQAYLELQADAAVAERAARVAYQQESFERARQFAALWQRIKPNDAMAHFYKALAFMQQSDYQQAFNEMLLVLYLQPETDFTRLVNFLSPHQFEQYEQFEQALLFHQKKLRALVEFFPDSYDIPLALAIIAVKQNQPIEAKRLLALAIDKGQYNLLVLEFGIALFDALGDLQKKAASYQLALKNFPDDFQLRHEYVLFLSQHFPEQALKQLDHLLQLSYLEDEQRARFLYYKALICLDLKRYDAAWSQIDILLAMQSNNIDILDSLGWVLYRMGRTDEAELVLRKALALAPHSELLADTFRKLDVPLD